VTVARVDPAGIWHWAFGSVIVILSACTAHAGQTPAATAYFCPMHPDVVASAPGACRKCGMALVPGNPLDAAECRLDVETVPRAVKAGRPARFRFTVFHPVTRSQIREFAVVHDQPYHLFVVSQDMNHFFHVHPEQDADGSFSIELTLPQPGYYRIYSDFLPVGGGPQVIATPLVTARFDGDVVASLARLEPDRSLAKAADGTIVDLQVDPRELVAGRVVPFTFRLIDEATRQPVADLEPYLGAWGHALILSEDMIEYIHAHPRQPLPDGADRGALRGGPEVIFEGLLPKPGRYRVWLQFRRRARTTTVPFTISVPRLGETPPG
jgi:hypothetical protein